MRRMKAEYPRTKDTYSTSAQPISQELLYAPLQSCNSLVREFVTAHSWNRTDNCSYAGVEYTIPNWNLFGIMRIHPNNFQIWFVPKRKACQMHYAVLFPLLLENWFSSYLNCCLELYGQVRHENFFNTFSWAFSVAAICITCSATLLDRSGVSILMAELS